jgi:hypothetical protein
MIRSRRQAAWQVEAAVAKVPVLRLEIVKRGDDLKGFVVLPHRWVVERTFLLVRPQSPYRQGLRKSRPNPRRLRHTGLHPDRGQTTRAIVVF